MFFIIFMSREICQDLQNPEFSKEDTRRCMKKIEKKFKLSIDRLKIAKSKLRREIKMIDNENYSDSEN